MHNFQLPVTYPTTAPEIAIPELDGKTAKMYRYWHMYIVKDFIPPPFPPFRGGKICLTDHFKPLWARNVPKFGIAHAMALGVSWNNKIMLGIIRNCMSDSACCLNFLAGSMACSGDTRSYFKGIGEAQGKE